MYREGLINQADWLFAQYHHSDAEKELSKAHTAYDDVIKSAGMFLLANMERIGKIDCTSFAKRENEALDNLNYYEKYVRELRGELHKLYSAEAQKYAPEGLYVDGKFNLTKNVDVTHALRIITGAYYKNPITDDEMIAKVASKAENIND